MEQLQAEIQSVVDRCEPSVHIPTEILKAAQARRTRFEQLQYTPTLVGECRAFFDVTDGTNYYRILLHARGDYSSAELEAFRLPHYGSFKNMCIQHPDWGVLVYGIGKTPPPTTDVKQPPPPKLVLYADLVYVDWDRNTSTERKVSVALFDMELGLFREDSDELFGKIKEHIRILLRTNKIQSGYTEKNTRYRLVDSSTYPYVVGHGKTYDFNELANMVCVDRVRKRLKEQEMEVEKTRQLLQLIQ